MSCINKDKSFNFVFLNRTTSTFRATNNNYSFFSNDIQKAQMIFYDSGGRMIKTVDLDSRGDGQLNVFADDLSNGIYTYALFVDGKIIDTKKMVKGK